MRKGSTKNRSFLVIMLCVILTAVSVAGLAACKKNDGPKVNFKLIVVGKDGAEKTISVETTKKTLGDALTEKNIVSGTSSAEYGLMVDTVDGVKLDWSADGYYWALYIGEEYAMVGVDSIEVTEGAVYKFVATSGY